MDCKYCDDPFMELEDSEIINGVRIQYYGCHECYSRVIVYDDGREPEWDYSACFKTY